MKTETKILIVAIIMILSVGPMSYFFSNVPKQIELPEENTTPTAYFFSGNVTGTIMDIQPYIYYVGVANFNSEAYVSSILDSIPEISNYSIEISLNPNGDGYQYVIKIPVDDISQIKKIGFRMAWRFVNIFEQITGSIPYVYGKIAIPQNFSILTAEGAVNAAARENQTLNVLMLYSREPGMLVPAYCQELMTSLTYLLIKTPNLCYDASMSLKQQYLGLSLMDIIFIKPQQKTMNLEAAEITGIELKGEYSFAGIESMSITGLEEETGSSIYLEPEQDNPAKGNFTILAPYVDMSTINDIKTIFKNNNFTIQKEYKQVKVLLPPDITLDGKTYELYEAPYATGLIGINDGIGFYNFNVSVTVVHDEIINIQVKKLNLS